MKKFGMFVIALVMVVVFTCPVVNAGPYRPGNIGVRSDSSGLVGHVAGNAMSWDYALIFKFRKRVDHYAALADIESSVRGGDELVAIGAHDRFIVMSLKSDSSRGELSSRYARASGLTKLIRVNSRSWINTNQYSKIGCYELTLGQAFRDN